MKKKSARTKTSETASDNSSDDTPPLQFEEGLSKTQQIVRDLESGSLTLEESLQAYEVGVRTIRHCQELLNSFERRIERLTGFDKEGNPITEPFHESDMTLEEKQQGRGRRRGAAATKKSTDDNANLF
ncbi:exodeoxyribonuclease VII small subunit [Rosistilla oblonga]|uniref:exodeoxyribonuclease VII small subunit n=1 Tax=Rosistilla oblonga TaxID=2527990 RepID=UPI003A97C868